MKAILIGAGGIARELLRRLSDPWHVTVVDPDPNLLEQAAAVRDCVTLQGDGSSRRILRQAGLEEADALIAATDDDESNLEACRFGREAGVLRLTAVAATPEREVEYHDLGVPAFSPASLTARQIELNLETRRIASRAFADGRAEAIEFRVDEGAPVCGRSLKELHSQSWLVGAILRGDRLIVPHGDTVLQSGDLVTVVGSAADFGEIVQAFTSGQPQFPLRLGKRIAVSLAKEEDTAVVEEAMQLVRFTQATSVLVIHVDPAADPTEGERAEQLLARLGEAAEGITLHPRPVPGKAEAALFRLSKEESVGVVAVPAPERRGLRLRGRLRRIDALARNARAAVLVCRGSYPYQRILVPARRTRAGHAAARAAIDLARTTGAPLHALAVVDPKFIAGTEGQGEARQAIGWIQEEAAVQGVEVEPEILDGNPIFAFQKVAREDDLLVLGADARSRRNPLSVRVSDQVARRVPCSLLVVPDVES
jgi:Trk K+ transport system NAD-binding subunit/nucleotide-binding universal stress UspA family protein